MKEGKYEKTIINPRNSAGANNIIIVGLSGCTDNNNDNNIISNEQKILGEWNRYFEEYPDKVGKYFFYSNGSYFEQKAKDTWGDYVINDDELVFIDKDGTITMTCEYVFSDNNNKLTLLTDWGSTIVLTRP